MIEIDVPRKSKEAFPRDFFICSLSWTYPLALTKKGPILMTEFTNRTVSPFRYDVVGSFLRPQELKDARAKFAKGEIS